MADPRELHPALLGFNQALSFVSYASVKVGCGRGIRTLTVRRMRPDGIHFLPAEK